MPPVISTQPIPPTLAPAQRAGPFRSPNWNIPNTLTAVRLALIPAILYSLDGRFEGHELVAPLLFVIASITDSLDGRIARRYRKVTQVGQFLDPLADKILILSVMAILVQDRLLPAWMAIVIVARELLITGLRSVAVPKGLIIAATPWGKTKTVSQMFAVGLLMLERPYPALRGPALVMLWLAVGFTIFSGLDYLWRYRRLLYR
ncbi:MAG: CDP-diacylglycerol--glycerol-3-phosphate 3-phosphatidyltransferase [Candidatus Dormibacteria bacterium]